MAKGELSPFHRTQGALPHCTCMSSMGHHCHNVAAVCQVSHLFAQDPIAVYLLHCLAQSMALFDFCIRAVHIAGCMNIGVDQLSRDRATIFLDCHPTTLLLPMQIPQKLTDLLLSPRHSWTSPLWRQLWRFREEGLAASTAKCTKQGGTATQHSKDHSTFSHLH